MEADIEHRRLLVWSTPDELTEVREFLGRLGESFHVSNPSSQIHVIDLHGADAAIVTRRFRDAWSGISDVPIVIDDPGSNPNKQGSHPAQPLSNANHVSQSADSEQKVAPEKSDLGGIVPARLIARVGLAPRSTTDESIDQGEVPTGPAGPTDPPKALRVIRGENDDLILLSRDPVVTETAKRLVEQFIPKPSDIKVIVLKHAQAITVKRQLESMLAATPLVISRLATTPSVIIEIDSRTNRLLIQHASAKQLKWIEEYVPTLDLPAPEEQRLVRQQKIYRFKNRKATDAVTVIKEVYRDLLTINDRTNSANTNTRPTSYNRNLAASATNPEYQGLLNLGVDEESNLLVVSAPNYLIEDIIKLAQSVDTASDGRMLTVVPYTSDPTNARTREALTKIFGEKKKP